MKAKSRTVARSSRRRRSGTRQKPKLLTDMNMGCKARFRVKPEFHRQIRKFTYDKFEHGGNVVFDFKNQVLTPGDEAHGEYASVDLSRGVVDWHTHPRSCLNDDMCALGLPSPTDLANVALEMVFGTVAHMVYSKEGTYVLQIDPKILNHISQSKQAVKEYQRFLLKKFEQLHQYFLYHHRLPYSLYRKEWLNLAQNSGIKVHFYKGDAVPTIKVQYDCRYKQRDNMHVAVDVPDDLGMAN